MEVERPGGGHSNRAISSANLECLLRRCRIDDFTVEQMNRPRIVRLWVPGFFWGGGSVRIVGWVEDNALLAVAGFR